MTVSIENQAPINQQAMRILQKHQIAFNPATELAALVLIQTALERGLLDTQEITEPEILITQLSIRPRLAMSLMTEAEPGETFDLDLPDSLAEAASMILEEIVASLKAA